ncbi:MAG: hypothetical protein M3441_10315 [Chloroflexota bacterium]|nr:hypothetical protein [Chloroflexota bacterium]
MKMNVLRVIFVHGISSNVIKGDYSLKTATLLLKKLTEYGVLARGATPEEVAQTITFEQVNYSMVGSEAQERLLRAYEQESEKLYSLVHRLNRIAGLDNVRRTMITAVTDVLIYRTESWREQIQQLMAEKLDRYAGTEDAVTVIAHSLGSVVAFETIYDNVRNNTKWTAANFKPSNLFTMGSPLALATLDMDRRIGSHNPPPGSQALPHAEVVLDEGVWYNFLDAQDLIAYPLEVLFQDRFKLQDIVVQTGANPGKAHTGYWTNNEVIEFIAGRLKLDFQRINLGRLIGSDLMLDSDLQLDEEAALDY